MPVNAVRLIRKLRVGAQAHLMECDDGRFYVVKFRNNPQHRRPGSAARRSKKSRDNKPVTTLRNSL